MGVKQWIIRAGLGVALGFGTGFVVEALHLALVVVIFGSLDEFLNRPHKHEEMWLMLLGFGTMTGSVVASMLASVFSVLIAPSFYSDRQVIRSWAMAALLAALAGGGVGGLLSLLHPQYLSLELLMTTMMACGALTGMISAIFLWVRVNR